MRAARERWAGQDARTHVERCMALLDRIQEKGIIVEAGTVLWARYDPNVDATRSGKATTGKARNAKGRITLDEKEYRERIGILLEDFGITEAQLHTLYGQRGDAAESFDPESFDPDLMPVPAVMPEHSPMPVKAPKAKREKLWWVPVLTEMAARIGQKAGRP